MTEQDHKLTLAIVESLKNKGFTQSEIADMYGVTRQYVSWIVKTYGGSQTHRQQVMQHFPWKVPTEIGKGSSPYRRIRDHAEYVVTNGVGMNKKDLALLRGFYRCLIDGDLVLEFDPDIPPSPGFAKNGGFALMKCLPEDGDLMIRVNEYTNLTDEGRDIWCLPDELP